MVVELSALGVGFSLRFRLPMMRRTAGLLLERVKLVDERKKVSWKVVVLRSWVGIKLLISDCSCLRRLRFRPRPRRSR